MPRPLSVSSCFSRLSLHFSPTPPRLFIPRRAFLPSVDYTSNFQLPSLDVAFCSEKTEKEGRGCLRCMIPRFFNSSNPSTTTQISIKYWTSNCYTVITFITQNHISKNRRQLYRDCPGAARQSNDGSQQKILRGGWKCKLRAPFRHDHCKSHLPAYLCV